MSKKILILFLSLFFLKSSFSQTGCSINAYQASGTNPLDCGDSLFIAFNAYANLSLQDTFGPNGPSDTTWASTGGAQYDEPYIPSPTNDDYFWMGPSALTPAALTTTPYDVSGGGQICFDFVYAVQGGASPIEGPDQYDEGISLQYNTGAGWVDIVYYAPNGDTLPANPNVTGPNVSAGTTNFTAWTSVCIDLPPGALTTSTSFQWVQENNSGACCDHWGLDNIIIATASPLYNIYLENDNSNLGPAPAFFNTLNYGDSVFDFYYTDGSSDTCYTTFNGLVNPTDVGPDLILDCNNNIVQLQANGVSTADNFVWTPPSGLSDPNILNPEASPLDTTQYVFTSSCGSDSLMVNVIANYAFSTSDDTAICVGESAVLEVFGGAQTYSWNANSGDNSSISDTSVANPTFTPTATTTYTIEADSAGCIKTNSITVYVSNKIFPLIFLNGAGCSGANNGSTIAIGSGGLGTITYSLDDGVNPTLTQSTGSFTGLAPGNYVMTITDSMSCPVDSNLVITGGTSVNIDSIYAVNPLCVGDTGGLFEVYIDTNVAAMYSINGATPQSSNVFSGLSDGLYSISATFGSCPASVVDTSLFAPATVDLTFIDSTDLSCFGSGDGEIIVSAFQGVGPYTYSSDNITFQTDSFFTNLSAGSYAIYTQDNNGCKDSINTSISEPLPSLLNNIVVTDATCFGDSGSISFDVINGTAPYQYSIDNGTNYSSSNTFNNIPAGPYTLIGMDTNGCLSVSSNDTIFEPAPIVLVLDSANPSTCGATDGEIFVSATGGVGALNFNIDGGAFGSSSSFTGLAAGPHTIIVMDANNCSSTINVSVSNSGGATLSIASFDSIQCFGNNTASVQLSTSGGAAPFQFNVDMGTNQPDSLFTNLSGGVHNFVVIDDNGCQDNISITIFEPAVLDLMATQDSVSCFGLSDGEINLVASGGTNPYIYALNDTSTVQFTPNFNLLSAGSNMAYVVDANGCIDSVAQDVFQADSLEITNIMTDSVSCFGGTDGQISFDGLGGIPAYSYSINGGASFVGTNTFMVDSGVYSIMVEDADGCQSVLGTTTVLEPTDLELDSINSVMTTCNLNNGSLEVLASGGTAPYTYSLNGGTAQPSGIFNNVSDMVHTVVVTDANLCTETINITVDAVTSVTLSVLSSSNVSCFGANDGTVNLFAVNGSMAYTYTLIGGATQLSPNFTNLNGGLKVFYVSDGACNDTVTVNILEPMAISLTAVQDSVSCNSLTDGQIILTASGGASGFMYALNDTSVTQSSATFSTLSAGMNMAYVIDANGCIDSVMQEVFEPDTLIITATNPVNISCSADGSFTVNASGGTGPYTYSISGGASNQVSNSFVITTGGTYTLSVDDSNGCPTATAIDAITAPTPVTFIVDSVTGTLLCNGSFNGFIGIVASGGTGPYTYSINSGPFQMDTFFDGLAPGTYTVNVQDVFNCLSTPTNVTISQPNGIAETTTGNSISCNGLTDGSIVVNTITGGTPPYDVTVNGVTTAYTPGMIFSNLPAGTYTGIIEDGNGCALSFTETVADVAPLSLTLESPQNVSCFGADDGVIGISVTGGTALYNYVISLGSFADSTMSDGLVYFDDLAGTETGLTYNIAITDANGCSASVTQTITQPNQLIVDSISVDPITCFGANDGELTVSASGGSAPYTYLWTPGNETGDMISGLNSGVYTVAVTDANNCTVSASQTVLSVDPLIATITPDSADINMGDTVQLGVNVQNAIGTNLQYSWTPTIGLSCSDCENPVVNMFNDIAYSVVVTDENGCDSYNFTQVFILVDGSLFYFIPNGFTPNGDGINDNFQVFGEDIKSVGMMVFNRWGEKVFDGDNQNSLWDGSFKGVPQTGGVYSYVVNIKFLNDAEVVEKGSVTLIK